MPTVAYEGPRRLRPDELPLALALCQSVFRPGDAEGDGLASEYPVTFSPENVDDMWVVTADRRPVAFMAVVRSRVWTGGCAVRCASLGAVCTDAAHRGLGLVTALLHHVLSVYEADCDILVVSRSRSLYRRIGCVAMGQVQRFSLRRTAFPSAARVALAVWDMAPRDLVGMHRRLCAQPVRFEKSLERFALQLFGRPMALGSGRTLMAEDAGSLTAWWVVQQGSARPSGPASIRIVDGAGDPLVWPEALPLLMDRVGAEEIELQVGPHQRALADRLRAAEGATADVALPGTFRALNISGLVSAVEPVWRHSGWSPQITDADAASGGVVVRLHGAGGRTVPLGPAALLRFIFGRPPDHPALGDPAGGPGGEPGSPRLAFPNPGGLDIV